MIRKNHKGVALIVVLLVILSATAIAVIGLRVMIDDVRVDTAFHYNRQAAQAARSVSYLLKIKSQDNANEECVKQRNSAIQQSIATGEFHAAYEIELESSDIRESDMQEFTGLAKTLSSDGTDPSRLRGDLSRPTFMYATTGNFAITPTQVAGFSESDSFSTFNMTANSYAVIGRPVQLREDAGHRFFLLSEINGRTSGFKREFGVYEISPLSCK